MYFLIIQSLKFSLLNNTGCSRQALLIGGQLLGLIEETLDPVSLGSCVGVFERATLAVNKQREGGQVMGQSVYGGSVAGDIYSSTYFILLVYGKYYKLVNYRRLIKS
jgi:hypothetical protein